MSEEAIEEDAPLDLPPPPKKTLSLMEQLEAMSGNAGTVIQQNAKKGEEEAVKITKARRRSRDLELRVDGMYKEEVEKLQSAFSEFEIADTSLIAKANIKPCLAKGYAQKLSDEVGRRPQHAPAACRAPHALTSRAIRAGGGHPRHAPRFHG